MKNKQYKIPTLDQKRLTEFLEKYRELDRFVFAIAPYVDKCYRLTPKQIKVIQDLIIQLLRSEEQRLRYLVDEERVKNV